MINKTKLALGIATATLTMAGALVSPQAMALSKADRVAEAANNKVDALEAQMQAMQAELSRLKAAANRPSADAGKVQELDQWMNSVKAAPKEGKKSKDNMVLFRGGYAHANQKRGGTNGSVSGGGAVSAAGDFLVGSDADRADKDAWYFGAAFDFSLNDDLFGLMDKTEVLAELGVEYKQYSAKTQSVLSGQSVTTNQVNLSAAPKIKFLKGNAFRPWLMPVGLDLNVVSPPSGAVTVLNPGLVFGVGADYKIWKDVYVGADTRYHYSTGNLDGVNTDGVTAGGYLGLGF
ncbi:MAG: hypothetical protein PHY54_19665 [Methylococcales bacterium]|nr:hypothetical protein [Methylococcales bacterium]